MSKFKRENRYIVIKRSDAEKYLNQDDRMRLSRIVRDISLEREHEEKDDLVCAVIESDWPMYEDTWKSVEDWVKSGQHAPQGNKALLQILKLSHKIPGDPRILIRTEGELLFLRASWPFPSRDYHFQRTFERRELNSIREDAFQYFITAASRKFNMIHGD